MPKPLVAIVGRPNVGKSTFFNKLAGSRISIVENEPGVTRDRVYADCEWQGREFTIIDTGGIDPYSTDPLLKQMRGQAEIAIETADVIVFMVDGREGLTGADAEVASMLRRANKPTVLAVNKIDSMRDEVSAFDFYALGIEKVHPISSVNMLNLGDLLDDICGFFDELDYELDDADTIKIAVVGKPNVGKSSLVNLLLGENRVMVSNIPGTTRDAIDTPLQHEGQSYLLIDTAGLRRKSRIEDSSIERYAAIRSLAAIKRSDVVLLLVDATEGITDQDAKIAGFIKEEGRACIIVLNKWDLVDKESNTLRDLEKDVKSALKFVDYAPVISISALTGQRANRLFPLINKVDGNARREITTGILNDALQDALAASPPPASSGRRLKIFYMTQRGNRPPTFIMFTNNERLIHFSYSRYLENYFRKTFEFEGTPLRFIFRNREKSNEGEVR